MGRETLVAATPGDTVSTCTGPHRANPPMSRPSQHQPAVRGAVDDPHAPDSPTDFRLLAEQVPAVIYRAQAQPPFRLLYVSPFVEQQFGHRPADWTGNQDWLDAVHPEDRERVQQAFEHAYGDAARVDAGLLQFEYRLRDAQGRWRHLRDVSRRVDLSSGACIQGVALDLTDLIEARHELQDHEVRLRRSEQRYRLAAAHGQVWHWDAASNELHIGAGFWTQFGHASVAPRQALARIDGLMHEDDRAHWRNVLRAHLKLRTPYELQFRLPDAAGHWRWLENRGQAQWGADGRVVCMAGIAVDVTPRKRAESALVTHQLELSGLTQRLLQQERVRTLGVAQALHDRLGQTLSGLRLHLDALARGDALDHLPGLVDEAMRELRQALHALRPPPLHDQGLQAALENVALECSAPEQQRDVLLEVEAGAHGLRWPPDVEYAMFMMVRETLDAVIDAGRAHLVRIVLEGDARQLCLAVIDDAPVTADGAAGAPEPLWRVALREHALSIRARLSFAPTADGLNRVRICWDNPPP